MANVTETNRKPDAEFGNTEHDSVNTGSADVDSLNSQYHTARSETISDAVAAIPAANSDFGEYDGVAGSVVLDAQPAEYEESVTLDLSFNGIKFEGDGMGTRWAADGDDTLTINAQQSIFRDFYIGNKGSGSGVVVENESDTSQAVHDVWLQNLIFEGADMDRGLYLGGQGRHVAHGLYFRGGGLVMDCGESYIEGRFHSHPSDAMDTHVRLVDEEGGNVKNNKLRINSLTTDDTTSITALRVEDGTQAVNNEIHLQLGSPGDADHTGMIIEGGAEVDRGQINITAAHTPGDGADDTLVVESGANLRTCLINVISNGADRAVFLGDGTGQNNMRVRAEGVGSKGVYINSSRNSLYGHVTSSDDGAVNIEIDDFSSGNVCKAFSRNTGSGTALLIAGTANRTVAYGHYRTSGGTALELGGDESVVVGRFEGEINISGSDNYVAGVHDGTLNDTGTNNDTSNLLSL